MQKEHHCFSLASQTSSSKEWVITDYLVDRFINGKNAVVLQMCKCWLLKWVNKVIQIDSMEENMVGLNSAAHLPTRMNSSN